MVGVWIPVRKFLLSSPKFPDAFSETTKSLLRRVTFSFSEANRGWCAKLTTHLDPWLRLRLNGDISLFLLYIFILWTGKFTFILIDPTYFIGGLGWRSGRIAALLVGRSRDRFPVVSLDFSVTYSLRQYYGPEVDSAPSENEYQEHFLRVKVAGAWGWQPHHLNVPNVMKSGILKFLEHSGPHWAFTGLLYL
jgi:hypothetical protein